MSSIMRPCSSAAQNLSVLCHLHIIPLHRLRLADSLQDMQKHNMKRSIQPTWTPPPNKRSRPSAIAPTTISLSAPEVFPHFTKGLVSIILDPADPDYYYQFHRAVLERSSAWFLDQMNAVLPREKGIAPQKIGQAMRFSFVLEKRDVVSPEEMEGWVLVRKVSHEQCQPGKMELSS
jgi:hypothetical protein